MLLEEKDKRIKDLRREAETLGIFAHYFKSLEYRRLEASTEEIKAYAQEPEEKPIVSPGDAHIVQEEREIVITQEPEEKPTRTPGKAQPGKGEKALIEKTCKNCNQPFFTESPKKETCSSKCRSAYSRRRTVN